MADDYGDLVELGIEGVDRITDKYHDHIYGMAGKHKPHFNRKKKDQNSRDEGSRSRDAPPQSRGQSRGQSHSPEDRTRDYRDGDPGGRDLRDRDFRDGDPRDRDPRDTHPKDRDPRDMEPRDRESREGVRGFDPEDDDSRPRDMYAHDRRRNRDRRDDGRRGGPYAREVQEDAYYVGPPGTGPLVARPPDPFRYPGAVVPRMPSPPPLGYAPGPYAGDAWAGRGRPMPARRRSSSWSPPRRPDQRRYTSPPRRVRSKSPNHHRMAATIVGALAGGFIANAAGKGKGGGVSDTAKTIAGAVVGGLGGREIEKMYDRQRDGKLGGEQREERRRRKRDGDRRDD